MSIEPGKLYVVATPIGNLGDISQRALDTLRSVAVIAAEDTRHSSVLLNHFGIRVPLISLHEHNEESRTDELLAQLAQGRSIALISDAGTPLISDPGFKLVRAARDAGVTVSPIPGACAAITALSAMGLPSDRFNFEGFLPAKSKARQERLAQLKEEPRTLIFYESSHRIVDSLEDAVEVLGSDREAGIAREMTKLHETLKRGSLAELLEWVRGDDQQRRGEFVLIVAAGPPQERPAGETGRILEILRRELPAKQAARIAAELTGERRNLLYRMLLDSGSAADEEEP